MNMIDAVRTSDSVDELRLTLYQVPELGTCVQNVAKC